MGKKLLDTDTLSEILKGRNASVVRRAGKYAEAHSQFTYTAVSVHEILFGLHYKDAKRQLKQAEASFAENEVIVPSLDDYATAGRIRGVARREGHQLAIDDCLIGAVAARLGIPVVTGNTGHFAAMRQAGLNIQLENWKG
jgi:predicted nucleic acid-binding protein